MKIRNLIMSIAPLALAAAMTTPACASVVLNFSGLNGVAEEGVANYYDGGNGSLGSGPGPNYGITFGSDAIVCAGAPTPGSCNSAEIPGGTGANLLFFLSGSGDLMNVAAGFNTGFSFYYAAPTYSGTVDVYSGLNGTGTLLASLTLPLTTDGASVPGCYGRDFCPYTPFGVTFLGTAESVDFSGTANEIAFADITMGSATPGNVPEPGALALLGAGLLALWFCGEVRRRRIAAKLRMRK